MENNSFFAVFGSGGSSGGGGATSLGDLSDVTLGTLETQQVLKYNGTEWVNDFNSVNKIEVRNDEGATIPIGTPLYSRGEIGGSNRILVGIADSDDPAKMPCIGLANAEMNTTTTQDNYAVVSGIYNENLTGYTGLSVGDTMYVSTSGTLTNTKPTGASELIQNVGIVLKTNGTIIQGLLVSAIGRTNDTPNTISILGAIRGGTLGVQSQYDLPTADGTANYVIKTDGAGNTSWVDVSTLISSNITGSGTNNYLAKFTPDGSTLGNSLIRDNGTTVGINVSPISNAIAYIDSSTTTETLRIRNTRNDGYGINSQATGGGTDIYGGTFNATSSSSVNNIGIRSTTQGTITGSNVAGSFATANTPYTTTYLGIEYVGIHSQVATNGAKNTAGLFISNSSNTTDNTGIYVKVSNAGSGQAYGIYENDGALNYFKGNTGIGVTPLNSEAILTVEDTRTSNLPAIYGFNSTQSYAQGVQGAVGDNVDNTSIDLATEGLVGVYGRVDTTNSLGSDYGIYGEVVSSSNNHLGLIGARGRILYSGTTTTRNITGGFFDTNVTGATAQVLNCFGIDVDSFTTDTATIGSHYGMRVQLRSQSGTPSISTSYGIYLDVSNASYISGTTTLYGIYQNGSGALNYLQGNTGIGNIGVSSSRLKIFSSTASVSHLQLVTSSGTDVSSPNNGDLWYNGTNLYFYDGTSNTDLLAGGSSPRGTTTVKQYPSNADIDLYNDGNIRIWWDVSGSDIEFQVLTNPATARVNAVATVGGVITAVDGLTSTGSQLLDGAFGSDESMYILIDAPSDTNYPSYEIRLKRSNATYYTNTPFLVIATKYTGFD